MTFLAINGWEPEVATARHNFQLVGVQARTQSGRLVTDSVGVSRTIDISTQLTSGDEARALQVMLSGLGDSWRFESATHYDYSGKGVGAVAGSTTARSTSNVKYGVGRLEIASAAYAEFNIALDSSAGWTVLFWYTPAATAWTHRALTSAGTHYLGGVSTAGATDYLLTTANSRPRLNGKTAADANALAYYDDLIVLPCVLPASIIAVIAAATSPWPQPPQVQLTGDYITDNFGSQITAVGDIGSLQVDTTNVAGDEMYEVSATLAQDGVIV